MGAALGACALAVAGEPPSALTAGFGDTATARGRDVPGAALWVGAGLAFPLVGYLFGRRSDLPHPSAPPGGRFDDRRCRREVARARRRGTPLALVVIDIDHLRAINEELGSQAGDRALRLAELSLSLACRRGDVRVHRGGDEFVVVAPGTSAIQASLLARRIQSTLAKLALEHLAGDARRLPVSVSIGIADLERCTKPDLESLYAAARRALNEAKLTSLRAGGLALASAYPAARRRSVSSPASSPPDAGPAPAAPPGRTV